MKGPDLFSPSPRPVTFTVLGEPITWKRVDRDPKFGHSFIPRDVRNAEKAIAWAYIAAGGRMLQGAVVLGCTFYLAGRCSAPELDPRDLDNLMKLVADALQKHAYQNDRRIVGYYPAPFKLLDKSNPRTVITVAPWPHPPPAPLT